MAHTRQTIGGIMAAGALALSGCASTSGPVSSGASAPELLRERNDARGESPEAAAIATLDRVLRHWQSPVARAGLADSVRREQATGHSLEEALMSCASAQKLWAFAQYGSLRLLGERLDGGVPVIVQLQENPRILATRHYALVTAYHADVRRVEGIDPDGRAFSAGEGEFWRKWYAVRCWMLTACPPAVPRWRFSVAERISRMQFYDGAGDQPRANEEAAQALVLDSNNPDLLVALANRERVQGRPTEADKLFRRALGVDPHNARAANNLAFMLAEQGRDLDEAADLSRRALLLEPTNANVLDTLGFVLLQKGHYADAAATLQRAQYRARNLPSAVQNEIGIHLVWALHKNAQDDLAQQVLRELLRASPGLLIPAELTGLAQPDLDVIN